ncbi:MAG TPA: hypothetical protein VIK01_06820 [Polyangiaceae bacterium]
MRAGSARYVSWLLVFVLGVCVGCRSSRTEPAPAPGASIAVVAQPALSVPLSEPLVSAVAAPSAGPARIAGLADYCNDRFQFCVKYPTRLRAEPPPINGDGQSWSSPDGAIQMSAWGMHLGDQTTDSLWKESTAPAKGKTFTVKTRSESSFIVSYSTASDAKIHYEKTIVSQDVVITLSVEYAAAGHTEIDPLMNALQKSLGFSGGVDP